MRRNGRSWATLSFTKNIAIRSCKLNVIFVSRDVSQFPIVKRDWFQLRLEFLEITNLTHVFVYLFISCLYMFRTSERSSSGDRIVLIHHPVWLVCVSECLVCLTGIASTHLHRLIIQDDVLIQFDLLMMSAVTLEHVETWNK